MKFMIAWLGRHITHVLLGVLILSMLISSLAWHTLRAETSWLTLLVTD